MQQINANALAVFAAEDRLVQRVAGGFGRQAIGKRSFALLRLIQTIHPDYPDLDAQLRQAYMNFGDQLAAAGKKDAAQEQYQQAELIPEPCRFSRFSLNSALFLLFSPLMDTRCAAVPFIWVLYVAAPVTASCHFAANLCLT